MLSRDQGSGIRDQDRGSGIGDRMGGAVVARRICAVILVLLTAWPAFASDYFGQVTFNGLPVPGVTVTATQGPSKTAATTNQDGIYHLADIADGLWTLTIEMFGFATITRDVT